MHRKMVVIIVVMLVIFGIGQTVAARDVPHVLLYAITGEKPDTTRLLTVGMESGETLELPALTGTNTDAGWSPDGRFIHLISTIPNGNLSLSLYDTNDDSTRHITDTLLMEHYSCYAQLWWSPDSRYLAYMNGDDAYPLMHIFDTRDGTQQSLPPPQPYPLMGTPWSPDGHYFSYPSGERDAAPGRVIWDMTSKSVVTILSASIDYTMRWLPDHRAAYALADTNMVEVFSFDKDRVADYAGSQLISASPDGRYLVTVEYDTEDGTIVRLIDTADGSVDALEPGYNMGDDYWSPDSRYLFYGTRDTSIYNLSDNSRHTLVAVPHDLGSVSWNPNGHVVAFARDNFDDKTNGTWIFDLDAGTFKRFNPQLIFQYGDYTMEWSPDGRYLTMLTTTGLNLYEQSTQTLHTYDFSPQSLDWSPDGRYLGFLNPTGGETLQAMDMDDLTVRSLTDTLTSAETGTHFHLIGWRGGDSHNRLPMIC